ncbi:poly(A) RNA polymerase GLD2 isoform X1 [Corapipo altera]|uniref:poly(A) RNA polymerase GLD2 isoform X1 n=1 Tax=Corapipo altera TaxID=415028 RepID=UPI000FD6AD26|nr:poly(A) RNA polymerase GLD2 isoform X1 [Corapipo altera]XP_027490600.1 poly(A) RNA polymerase GLD2 isoform X1 [Corapipo altera]
MFPNSSNLGRPPFPSKHQQQSNFFNVLPVNIPPTLSHQQTVVPPLNFRTAVLSRALLSGNLAATPAVTSTATLQPMTYGNVSPVSTSGALTSFQGRKRQSEQSVSRNVKRQRIDSQNSDTTVVNQAVPLPEERQHSFPGPISIQSPSFLARGSPALARCVPPLRDTLFPDPTEARLPLAKDELSQQVLELFQACQQQASDLDSKELCRTELQREIQLIFPQSRLYLVGSSLNGFGTRSSDGDLCLVVKEEPVNQKTEARRILSSVQKLFSTKLSSYIERPQLIRAKVPIVKFRDKVSSYVEFDLNVNNVVGIRNTFLLRTYAFNFPYSFQEITARQMSLDGKRAVEGVLVSHLGAHFFENRVRPLVLVIKKWASFHEINDASRGTLNSYSLVLMVLHYLQTLPEPILPSLQKNYPECFDPTMQLHLVHQAPCTIPPYISKNGSSLGDLLIGFFKYYATEFDWSHQMISVREAKAIPRPDGIEWRNKFICVEEPFDGTNTARAVHEKQKFDMIRGEFAQAWRVLRDKKDLKCILPLRADKLKR